jgi:hypothetical protein
MRYTLVSTAAGCCPAPAKLTPILKQIAHETGAQYQSVYRGTDARSLLNHCGKHDQAWLYANLPRGVANPPGRSTHELKSDGVAYSGPVGRRLLWWQCGIDIDDGHVAAFIKSAASHGYTATITYPGSRVEYHHVNFRKAPRFGPPALKKGSRGPRVVYYSRWLSRLGIHLSHGRYHFDHPMVIAVKQFQRLHHQKVDGIIGTQTARQLKVAIRRYKKEKKK